jgi:hypothetical protein
VSSHPAGQGGENKLKRTPLYELHKRLGAKLVEFGGWEMPVQYTSIMDEHLAVRKAAGIFDISHMGQVMVSGSGSEPESFLNRTLTNDVRKLAIGQGQYTLMCNERGGVIDDLYVYRETPSLYRLIVNASRTGTDVAWLQKQLASSPEQGLFELKNISDKWAALLDRNRHCARFRTEKERNQAVWVFQHTCPYFADGLHRGGRVRDFGPGAVSVGSLVPAFGGRSSILPPTCRPRRTRHLAHRSLLPALWK